MSEYDKDEKPATEYVSETIISTSGVKVNFGDFWALKGIDITIKRGEIIVILGPSGSGNPLLWEWNSRYSAFPCPTRESTVQFVFRIRGRK